MTEIKPLVSVIMGIYNCAGTLEKAVKCIQNQTENILLVWMGMTHVLLIDYLKKLIF